MFIYLINNYVHPYSIILNLKLNFIIIFKLSLFSFSYLNYFVTRIFKLIPLFFKHFLRYHFNVLLIIINLLFNAF